jgi:hypothetical protein
MKYFYKKAGVLSNLGKTINKYRNTGMKPPAARGGTMTPNVQHILNPKSAPSKTLEYGKNPYATKHKKLPKLTKKDRRAVSGVALRDNGAQGAAAKDLVRYSL